MTSERLLQAAVRGLLGDSVRLLNWEPVAGVRFNAVYRCWTDAGEYAIKDLSPRLDLRGWLENWRNVTGFEGVAASAGLSMPRPLKGESGAAPVLEILDSGERHFFRGHEWVQSEGLVWDSQLTRYAEELGASLARIHSLPVAPWSEATARDETPCPEELEVLAHQAGARRSVASVMAGQARELTSMVNDGGGDGVHVVGHRDLAPGNLLSASGRLILVDWDNAGPISTGGELGKLAFNLLQFGSGVWAQSILRRVVLAYVVAGGRISGNWLREAVDGNLQFLAFLLRQAAPSAPAPPPRWMDELSRLTEGLLRSTRDARVVLRWSQTWSQWLV